MTINLLFINWSLYSWTEQCRQIYWTSSTVTTRKIAPHDCLNTVSAVSCMFAVCSVGFLFCLPEERPSLVAEPQQWRQRAAPVAGTKPELKTDDGCHRCSDSVPSLQPNTFSTSPATTFCMVVKNTWMHGCTNSTGNLSEILSPSYFVQVTRGTSQAY